MPEARRIEEEDRVHAALWNGAWDALKTSQMNEEYYRTRAGRLSRTDRRLRVVVVVAGASALGAFLASFGVPWVDKGYKAIAAVSGMISAILPWLRFNERSYKLGTLAGKWSGVAGRALLIVQAMKLGENVDRSKLIEITTEINSLKAEDGEPRDRKLLEDLQREIEERHRF